MKMMIIAVVRIVVVVCLNGGFLHHFQRGTYDCNYSALISEIPPRFVVELK